MVTTVADGWFSSKRWRMFFFVKRTSTCSFVAFAFLNNSMTSSDAISKLSQQSLIKAGLLEISIPSSKTRFFRLVPVSPCENRLKRSFTTS